MRRSSGLPALLLGFLFLRLWGLGAAEDYELCAEKTRAWHSEEMERMRSQGVQHRPGSLPELRSLLFFLHIPRTGGRTYHQCFLKVLFSPGDRCPRSYDTLRLNPKNPECRLLSTHDDYSLTTRLPMEATSVVTNVRDPADRLLSAYEFMVEIAARSLRLHPGANATQETQEALMAARRRISDKKRTETRNVWPWNHLVPLMEDDLWTRRNRSLSSFGPDNGPYETPRLVMPLREFARHPLVRDLIHDGGTMQVAGLTNNSCLPEAALLRSCARAFPDLGDLVLEVAKGRLERMLYVGLTEAHRDSARLFAHVIGRPLSAPAHVMNIPQRVSAVSGQQLQDPSWRGKRGLGESLNPRVRDRMSRRMGGVSLQQHYQRCVEQQRGRYLSRRAHAMKPLDPVSFSKEARAKIPADWMEEFRAMNRIDMGLLEHAREIFKKEQEMYGEDIDAAEAEEAASLNRSLSALIKKQIEEQQHALLPLQPPVPTSIHFPDEHLTEDERQQLQREQIELEDKESWEARQKEMASAKEYYGSKREQKPRPRLMNSGKVQALSSTQEQEGGQKQEPLLGFSESPTPFSLGGQGSSETVPPRELGQVRQFQDRKQTVSEWSFSQRNAGFWVTMAITAIAGASLMKSRMNVASSTRSQRAVRSRNSRLSVASRVAF